MGNRQIASLGVAALLAVAVTGISGKANAGSVTYEIKYDTSVLVPGAGGLIDFYLDATNPTASQTPPTPASVSVRAYNPSTDGILSSTIPVSGNAMGDLTTPAGVTTDNSTAPNELQQRFSVASFFDVFVTLSGSEIGPGASGNWSGTVFTLSVFDSQPSGNYLYAQFSVNPNVDQNGNPIVDGTVGTATSGVLLPNGQNAVQIIQLAVPEPSSVVLLSLGMGAVIAIGRCTDAGRRLIVNDRRRRAGMSPRRPGR